jgi:hypothetical protein
VIAFICISILRLEQNIGDSPPPQFVPNGQPASKQKISWKYDSAKFNEQAYAARHVIVKTRECVMHSELHGLVKKGNHVQGEYSTSFLCERKSDYHHHNCGVAEES